MSHSPEQQQKDNKPRAAETLAPLWPKVSTLPEDGNLFLIFHGLFCFAYKAETRTCQVGVHNDAPGHTFRLGVWEVMPEAEPRLTVIESERFHDTHEPITINVEAPRVPDVGFFMDGPAHSPHYHDWRRVPDLEGPNFFDVPLGKVKGKLRPVITIQQGVFFSERLTDSEFVRIDEGNVGDIIDLGNIAYHVGADISGQRVTVKVGGEDLLPPLVPEAGKRYVLYFYNSCPDTRHPPCAFTPNSPVKSERNDFHLYFRALNPPPRRHEYLLVKKCRPGVAPQVEHPSGVVEAVLNLELLGQVGITSTHDAPCGASSTGRTSGIEETGP